MIFFPEVCPKFVDNIMTTTCNYHYLFLSALLLNLQGLSRKDVCWLIKHDVHISGGC